MRRKSRLSYEARLRRMLAIYREKPTPSEFNWSVIQCHFRNGMSIDDTARILKSTVRMIEIAIDEIKQKAK